MGRCEVGSALCGQPAGTPPGPARPAPPTPTPAAGERRPGGRCGLGRDRRKVSGGRARGRTGCPVRRRDARERAGGERPRGQRWGWCGGGGRGGLVRGPGRVFGWAERIGSLWPEGDSGAGASLPGNELPAARSAGSGGSGSGNPHREARSSLPGEDPEFGTGSIQLLREGPSERTCRLSTALPELSLARTPPAFLKVLSRVVSSVISAWFS